MKKIGRYIYITFLSVFLVVMVVVIIFMIKNMIFIGSIDKAFVNYLSQYKHEFNSNSLFADPEINYFNDEVFESDIILLGEKHGYADVQNIDKSLFFYFNKKLGTRYYVAEMDSICANELNLFLQGEYKDTILLKKVILNVKKRIPQQAGKELFQKWSDIYDYNRKLPDSNRIVVLGIDKNTEDHTKGSRDSMMVENFLNIIKIKKLDKKPFYGFFGLAHVIQKGVNSKNTQFFAARLKSKGFKVKSIVCFEIDSEMYLPKNDQYPTPQDEKVTFFGMDGPIVMAKGINELKKAGQENITLFNLEETESPYNKSQKLINIKTNFIGQDFFPYNKDSHTTDFFQYVIFLRNSKPITPFK